ncbi:hypothetical protein VTO58DRAFT_107400 [Aureobasidium pullulans]
MALCALGETQCYCSIVYKTVNNTAVPRFMIPAQRARLGYNTYSNLDIIPSLTTSSKGTDSNEFTQNYVFEILEMMQDWYNTGLSEPITTTSPYDTVIDPTIATYYPNMDFGTGSNTSIALLYSTGVSPKTVDPYQHDDIQSYFNSAASAVLRVNNLMLAVPSEPEPSAKAARKLMSP